MRRALVLVLVILTALAAAGPTAGAAQPRHSVYFELHTDGFLVQASSNLGSGRIRMLLDRHGAVAYYRTAARVGERTVKARFGHLGAIDLRFTPDRGEGAVGCGGERGWQHGTFRGAIVFRGEHQYAHVDAARAHGWFQTRPANRCARRSRGGERTGHSQGSDRVGSRWRGGAAMTGAAGVATASRAAAVAETGVDLEGTTANSPPATYFYFFTENHSGGIRTTCEAFRGEQRDGMQIIRGAQVYGGAAALQWNLVAGTATLEPPAPFIGRAFYRREAGGRSRWWGSLRVPILGGRPMRLTGAAFRTRLGPNT
jgi:hypothetical protein